MAKIRFADRMSDSDALMWRIEKDPLLRSTVACVWILDRAPDRRRLEDRIERATRLIPRLRQRVVSNPWSIAPPRWETDPNFDLGFHVRRLRAPDDGGRRALLDLAQTMAMQAFDPARPLWELAIVDGLEGGRAAIIMKLHHSISDGVGLVRMTGLLVEKHREPNPERRAEPLPLAPEAHVMGQWPRLLDALGHEGRRQLGRATRAARAIVRSSMEPAAALRRGAAAVGSLSRMMAPAAPTNSACLTARSLSIRFDTLRVSLEDLKAAGKASGGTVNDAFVAGVCGGLRLYHERHRCPVQELRMTMPINIRADTTEDVAGNQFVPARFTVPVGLRDPVERMREIHRRATVQRREPGIGLVEEVTGVLGRFPTALSVWLFGSMLKRIDFVTSNVPGPPFEIYASGARIEETYGFGPLVGAAINVTLFSYAGGAHIAINTDRGAVPDPEALRDCLRAGLDEVIAVASPARQEAAAGS